jgi:hypothetical protein
MARAMNRCTQAPHWLQLVVATLLLLGAGSAMAQVDIAGRFIVVTGDVRIVGRDGAGRVAARDDVIRQGESIVTGPNSLVQLRMTDGGALSVRQDTELKLDSYRYAGSDDRNASFFMSIVKGGLRTITGLIGRTRRDAYRITTPSATMGIRGTHFEVVHVVQQAPDAQPGTYNRVYDGLVTLRNRLGNEVLIRRDQTGFVALPGNLAPILVKPPLGVFGRPTPVPVVAPQSRGAGDGQAADKAAAPRAVEAGSKDRVVAPASARTLAPVQTAPLLNPIDSPATMSPSRTISPTLTSPTTTISPVQTAPLLTPIDSPTTTTISPATTTISPATTTISPTLISPTTTTISPTTTTISPTTTTISPTLISPATTTISPSLSTTISPTTTTISPTTTTIAPTTTTISPILTSPTTTIQTAPTTSTIIRR